MPELPDITVYVERIRAIFGGQRLVRLRVASPFVLRSFEVPTHELEGLPLSEVRRLGKRLVLRFGLTHFAVMHLMIAGRLHLRAPNQTIPKRNGLLAFDFESATLLLTEASTQKRASLHLVRDEPALEAFERGGLEPLQVTASALKERLQQENRTLKRALTDPRLLSGVGNAYSDEVLHRARLSPVARTQALSDEQWIQLHRALQEVLEDWTERLRADAGDTFPKGVTAFRPEMAVHGKFGRPCPVCGTTVQRIRYVSNELNYCPRCQTGGKVLADRSLSRLLKGDWPKTIEELEHGPAARRLP